MWKQQGGELDTDDVCVVPRCFICGSGSCPYDRHDDHHYEIIAL